MLGGAGSCVLWLEGVGMSDGWCAISCLLVSGKIVLYVFGVGVLGCIFGGFGHCGGVLGLKIFLGMLLSCKREKD